MSEGQFDWISGFSPLALRGRCRQASFVLPAPLKRQEPTGIFEKMERTMRKETLSGILAAAFVLGMILCAVNIPPKRRRNARVRSRPTAAPTACAWMTRAKRTASF